MTSADAIEVVTLRAAGQRFGVSPSTLRAMAQRGELAGAYRRPNANGEEWVVPALTVEALLAANRLTDTADDTSPTRMDRRAWGVAAVAVGAVLVLLGVLAGLLVGDGDSEEPSSSASPAPATAVDAEARRLVADVLTREAAPGAAVGLLGSLAPELAGDRPTVRLPAVTLPPVVVVAGDLSAPEEQAVQLVRDQGELIVSLAGRTPAVEVWRVPDGSAAPATPDPAPPAPANPVPATPAPPAPAPPAAQPTTGPPPAAAGTIVVTPGDSLWTIAASRVAAELGHPPTTAEIDPYWRALMAANDDVLPQPGNPSLILPGMTLELPP